VEEDRLAQQRLSEVIAQEKETAAAVARVEAGGWGGVNVWWGRSAGVLSRC
jgi:hypothetical protein